MIPEYKLYHGSVLSELVDKSPKDLSFGELDEDGRLFSYTLNQRIGMQIKHSSKRLTPWQFTFTKQHIQELGELTERYEAVFAVLVCGQVGMVTLSILELVELLDNTGSDQAFVRVDRKKGKRFSVTGSGGTLKNKKSNGITQILESLGDGFYPCSENN